MSISRNQQHFIIMTVIYDEITDFVVGKGETFRDATKLIEELTNQPFDQVDDYIKRTVALSLQNYGKIISAFEPFLINWKWERLPLLTQAVLIMSYAHYYFVEKVDRKVVINVAIELAKKYIDPKQAKFINAILEKVLA